LGKIFYLKWFDVSWKSSSKKGAECWKSKLCCGTLLCQEFCQWAQWC
jgi:hypothetical protein